MTKFTNQNLTSDGEYLMYVDSSQNRLFVARFKYRRQRDRAGFKFFLIKNFSVEEYFEKLNAGESPVEILATKGYVSKTVRAILRRAGYPETREGFSAYITANINARKSQEQQAHV